MARRKPDPSTENLDLFSFVDEDDRADQLQTLAFDEMNIVETPFSLLTRDTAGKTRLALNRAGSVRLVCADAENYGLPNALAPRAVLGLMWACKGEHGLQRIFRVRLRELVTEYMWPDRFKNYNPGSKLLRSVEQQLNCVANTRIHSDRWFDKALGTTTEINAAIIDYVQVVEPGGRNRARVLEIGWGEKFWQSMKAQYTKGIDPRLLQRIENPLEFALYRLLDRQLKLKPRQRYGNIVEFARGKLGMTGVKIDSGGRTASSYIMKRLQEAVEHLNFEGFAVRAIFDKTQSVFAVTFERIELPTLPAGVVSNEVQEQDKPADLIREFLWLAHGLPKDQPLTRIRKADRQRATEWLDTYGETKAKWMVNECLSQQRQQGREAIQLFTGLQIYEAAASGSYNRHESERAGQLRLKYAAHLDELWKEYSNTLSKRFSREVSREEKARLKAAVEAEVQANNPTLTAILRKPLVVCELRRRALEHWDGMPEEEFRAFTNPQLLHKTLLERHGFAALRPPARE